MSVDVFALSRAKTKKPPRPGDPLVVWRRCLFECLNFAGHAPLRAANSGKMSLIRVRCKKFFAVQHYWATA
jgi:hypothetical protein